MKAKNYEYLGNAVVNLVAAELAYEFFWDNPSQIAPWAQKMLANDNIGKGKKKDANKFEVEIGKMLIKRNVDSARKLARSKLKRTKQYLEAEKHMFETLSYDI